ncbi:MAG: hypothetical protein R3176_07470 [Woeseiaceae bacterium]|nr:hypothetical protein [Woeseiaceae bacterium]
MIRACVAEIGRRLEYPQAAEVLHRVTGFRQKNLAETEVRIETAVTERDAGNATHRYEARCVTGPLTEIVDFRLREAARPGARSDAAPLDQKASQVSVFAASS